MLQSRIFRRYRGILLAGALALLCSCSVYEDDEGYFEGVIDYFVFNGYLLWMLITKPREVTVEDMQEMFAEHRDVMMGIVQTCEEYPRINRIYVDEGDEFYGEGEVGLELTTVVESVRSSLAEIPASQVICGRRHNVEGNPLSVVSFVVYAIGLSVSGTLKTIDYRTEWLQISSPLTWDQMQRRGYIEMLDEGWYIYVSES